MILDRFRLDGKVAIVTGASSGLGVAFASALAEAGADVSLGARRVDRLCEVVDSIEGLGHKAIAVPTDVTRPEDCDALVDWTCKQLGRVDILVNNAGVGAVIPALKETPAEFRDVVDVNVMGSYWMAQACGRVMAPGSSIVNIGSVLGFTTTALPQAAYTASKAAIMGLTRDLAAQWSGRRGIRVNAVAPGYFLTEMTAKLKPDYLEGLVEQRIPVGRLGDLDECAAAVVFLASDASAYITGAVVPVDGGLLVT
ncbi:MAG TPA: SDR family oxidoreductase [Acidimicrobiales bacterium]|jgi:NAD(P)-dependent dehydrogenase (short-subunit alcohol dehydrogenase family)|nr:SDR family oxidoreductase [Acidimicrobiales bacterium]